MLHIDWSVDSRYLRSVSTMYELFFWDVDAGQRVCFLLCLFAELLMRMVLGCGASPLIANAVVCWLFAFAIDCR